MPLRDKIETDYKNSLKTKDKAKISTYRLILSGIKDLDIINRSGPNKKYTDEEDNKKLLKNDGQMKVWFTKDKKFIPIKIEQSTNVGTMVMELEEYNP